MEALSDGDQGQAMETTQLQVSCGDEILLVTEEEGLKESVPGIIVGHKLDTFLAVETPEGIGLGSRPLEGSRVTVLCFQGGKIQAFESALLGRIDRPFRVIFLDYPQTVKRWSRRQEERVEAFLPATLIMGADEIAGVALDISLGGCGFSCSRPTDHRPWLKAGQRLKISFNLAAEEDQLALPLVKISHLNQNNGTFLLGLEFEEPGSEPHGLVADYIRVTAKALGAEVSAEL